MMLNRFHIAIFLFLLPSGFLYGHENEQKDNSHVGALRSKKYGFGVKLGVGPNVVNLTGAEVESPTFEISNTQLYLGGYVEANNLSVRGAILNQDYPAPYSEGPNFSVSSGLILRYYFNQDFAGFAKVGPNLLWQNTEFTTQSRSWGWQASFGAEYIIIRQLRLDSSAKWDGSLFSEIVLLNNNARADKLPGSPQFFNYTSVNIGVRSYI